MPVTHTNRKGVVYSLYQGLTRTGKPRYYFSKAGKDTLVETLPAGYEVYEDPRAQVYLRRILKRTVLPEEVALTEAGIRQYAGLKVYLLNETENAVEVYLPDNSVEVALKITEGLFGPRLNAAKLERWQREGSFSPAFRFVLLNQQTRNFAIQRWCYLGSIDNWSHSLALGSLETLVAKYAPHLGKESYFNLM